MTSIDLFRPLTALLDLPKMPVFTATAFAMAVGKWRTAEVMLQKVVASIEALKQESKDAPELLISACQDAG